MPNKKLLHKVIYILIVGLCILLVGVEIINETNKKSHNTSYSNTITAQGLSVRKYLGLEKFGFKNYTGNNINVAIIDSGIAKHDDIQLNRILFFKDFLNNNTIPYDDYGHGTFVAGIIGANGKLKGIAPQVNFIILKVLDRFGKTDRDTLYSAFEWVYDNAERYKIKVINLSIGVTPYLKYQDDPLCKLIKKINEKGMLIICSAGDIDNNNGTKSILSPGISPYVITVGSCKNNSSYSIFDDNVTTFSANGQSFSNYHKPDLVTLGVDILSLDYLSESGYTTHSGTSTSCAIVTGFASLLFEKYTEKSSSEIKEIILKNTVELKNDPLINQGNGELFITKPYRVTATIR